MIKRTFEITARIEQGQIPFCFQVVQNDKDVYVLRIRITDGGREIDYNQVSSATITFALANGAVVQSAPNRLSVSSAGIIYQMGTSEIAYPGKVLASIQLFGSSGERLTTARFQFEVVADLITPGAVQSESRFPILQQLLADVEQLKQDIVNLQIPDGSIMDVKLSDAAGQIKQRFASHLADYDTFKQDIHAEFESHKADSAYYVTDYGADKTGMTNSAPAIQNAINAANTAGGGVVYFPKGTYIIASTLTVNTNIKLVGAGINKSIIKRPSGSNFNMIVMNGDYGEIVDLTIDGNASENADIKKSEIVLKGQFCIVRNCMIANSPYIGIEVSADNCKIINCISTGSNSPTIPSLGVWSDTAPNYKQNLLIDGCVFKNHGINAILATVDGLQIINCIFINNHLQTSPTGGGQIFLKQSANGNYVISDNIFKDGGGTVTSGIECEASNVVISNNIIERHKFYGIALSRGSNYVIQGNIIRNNGNISSGGGIRITSGVNDFIIANNYIYDNQTVKTQKYGISILEGNSGNFIISNNFFDGNITNHISDSSAGFNKKIENNIPSNVNFTYRSFALANEEIKQLTPGSVPALIEIYDISWKAVAKFMTRGSDNAVVKIFDPLNVFDITDTGTGTAVYHDGTNYVMKNKGTTTRYYSVKITLL